MIRQSVSGLAKPESTFAGRAQAAARRFNGAPEPAVRKIGRMVQVAPIPFSRRSAGLRDGDALNNPRGFP
jgi:hypothetical protein